MNNPNLTGAKNNNSQQGAASNNKPFIEVVNPEEFPNANSTGIMTTYDIGLKISELLSKVYSDFAGVNLTPVTNGGTGFCITLYFAKPAYEDENATRAFNVMGEAKPQNQNSIVANLSAAEQRMVAKMYSISDDGKAGLGQFVFDQLKRGGVVDWNFLKNQGCIGEKQDPEKGVLAMVTGCFDILKFIKMIYGTKNKAGHAVQYSVAPIRPQTLPVNGMMMGGVEWLVSITQYDMVEMQAIARKSGIINCGTGTYMVPRC